MKRNDRGADHDGSAETPSMEPRARVARVALIALVLLAVGGAYAYYVVRHRESLVARDLRSLSMLTAQIESVLAEARTTLRAYARDATEPKSVWPDERSPAEYREFELLRRNEPAQAEPADSKTAAPVAPPLAAPRDLIRQHIAVDGGKARLELRYTSVDGDSKVDATGVIDLKRLARPFFAQESLSIFEMVLLAAPDGKVLYAVPSSVAPPLPVPHRLRGDRRVLPPRSNGGFVVTDLGALSRHTGWREWERLDARTLGGASQQLLVRTTEREYYLFTVPLRFVPEECPDCTTDGQPAADSKLEAAELLVCALVPKAAFRSQALAVPAPLFAIAAGVLLLLACCWPFIRIVKLDARAPLTPPDVVMAAVAALVAAAILTVAVSDTRIFRHLGAIEDKQLENYALKLRSDFMGDLLRVCHLAENLRDVAPRPTVPKDQRAAFMRGPDAATFWARGPVWRYPYFERVMWIQPEGTAITFDATGAAPPPIDVRGRRFFDDLRANRWAVAHEWGDEHNRGSVQHRYIAEIMRTRDSHVTILAVPPAGGAEGAPANGPVFAVVTPFIHFVDGVVPPGFRFAVIDEHGAVLFHSDRERSLSENLFRETDDDRHLRSAFFARHGQPVNGRYWGVDHQMYVVPIPESPWAIVAMRDESLLRAVNNEIIATTTLLLTLLAVLYATGFALLAVLKPKYRAPWLWPHDELRRDYMAAITALLLEVAAFAFSIAVLTPAALLFIGFTAPVRGIVTAYVVMNFRRGRGKLLIRDGHDRYWLIGVVVAVVLTVLWCVAIGAGTVEPALEEWIPAWVFKSLLIALVAATLVLTVWRVGTLGWAGETVERTTARAVAWVRSSLSYLVDPRHCKTFPSSGLPPLMPYALTGFLMLFVASALPSLAFLKVASRLGVEARVKWSQLELAAMLERRLNLLERENIRPARIAHDCSSVRSVFGSVWTLIPRSVAERPATYVADKPLRQPPPTVPLTCGSAAEDETAWIPNYLHTLLPRYSETSVAMRELHHDRTSDWSWWWCRDVSTLTLRKAIALEPATAARFYSVTGSPAPPPVEQALLIRSVVPHLFALTPAPTPPEEQCDNTPATDEETASAGYNPPPSTGTDPEQIPWILFRALLYVTVIGLGVYVLFSAVGFMGRRVFLAEVTQAPWLPRDEPLKPNAGAHLFVHHTRDVAQLVVPNAFATFSLADVEKGTETWSSLARKIDATPAPEVLIMDFEAGGDDPFFSGAKLTFIEALLAARRHTLIVFSRVPATTTLARGTSRDRWKRVFDTFMRIDESLLLHTSPAREHDHGTEPCGPFHLSDLLPEQMLQRSWDECSRTEKLLLYQIAVHGLANGKNAQAVESLLSRHFICRAPALRVCCRPFHNFVLTAGEQENLGAYETAATATPWDRLRLPIAFLAIVTLSLIVSTQQDVINATSAIITGLAAGLPALIKLVAILSGKKAADVADD